MGVEDGDSPELSLGKRFRKRWYSASDCKRLREDLAALSARLQTLTGDEESSITSQDLRASPHPESDELGS